MPASSAAVAPTFAAISCDGFLVAVTGSKFLAGPPFAGALALPPALANELAVTAPLATDLSHYTALHDWSALMRGGPNFRFGSHASISASARWIAALEQLDPVTAVKADLRPGSGKHSPTSAACAPLVSTVL